MKGIETIQEVWMRDVHWVEATTAPQ